MQKIAITAKIVQIEEKSYFSHYFFREKARYLCSLDTLSTLSVVVFAGWLATFLYCYFVLLFLSTSSFAKKKPVDFDDELRIGDVRYDNMI